MYKSLTIGLLLLSALSSCQDTGAGRSLSGPKCSSSRMVPDSYFSETSPAVDEGTGVVSRASSSISDTVAYSYELLVVQCSSGNGMYLSHDEFGPGEVYYPALEKRFERPTDEVVDILRSEGYLSDFQRLAQIARAAGFEARAMQADQSSERVKCACKLYYPKQTGDWVTRDKIGAAASK